MAIQEKNPSQNSKLGLLVIPGVEAGKPVPGLDPSEVPNKVGTDGNVYWRVFDPQTIYFLNVVSEIASFLQKQEDQVLNAIFKGFRSLSKALMGFHLPPVGAGSAILSFPLLSKPEYWEAAPRQIQEVARNMAIQNALEQSAREYLSPQIKN